MLTYESLKDRPRDFLAATGLTHEEFARLLAAFAGAYAALYPLAKTLEGKVRQRQVGGGTKGVLPEMEDKLLFIVVYQKTHPLQTMHGLHFGLSQPQANYWIHHLLPVLQRALADLGLAPEREASRVAESPLALEGASELAIDGSERRRQRPQDAVAQKEHYSGKKKAHTDKNILVVNRCTRKVVYVGPTVVGKTHDKKAADEASLTYPLHATLDKDTGFQGYEPEGVLTRQPKKKPRGQELSVADRWLNRLFSSGRVVVEHVIAGVKRCRIVKDVLRLTKGSISDLVMEIACGLHNLRVSCRHPLPAFDLLSLVDAS
jgi:hypothetical protein